MKSLKENNQSFRLPEDDNKADVACDKCGTEMMYTNQEML